jgi:ABC-2 type transport system ATP-binding protein
MSSSVAEFKAVSKSYPSGFIGRGRRIAVADVSFSVQAGEVFGLLGPNRAGKTTLIKALLSLCQPTAGQVFRFQKLAADRGTLAHVGYAPENQSFPLYLNAEGLLEYYGALTLMPEPYVRKRAGELLSLVGLADRAREPIARFSKGMVQRLALAQALINDPELLVLDEPYEGLDLPGRKLVRDVITERRRLGHAVLLVTHVLPEASELCDRVGVLIEGRLSFVGTVKELTEKQTRGGSCSLEQALASLYGKAT